jgi:hypothetical protein
MEIDGAESAKAGWLFAIPSPITFVQKRRRGHPTINFDQNYLV